MIDVINDNELSVADPGISKQGGGVRILGVLHGVCFDIPYTHTLCFLVTVENKVHILSTV